MKHLFRAAIIIFMGLSVVSCSDDEPVKPPKDPFVKNINQERFTKLEIGNLDLETLQSATNMHVNFTFVGGKSNFTKITLDIEPVKVGTPKKGEKVWKLKNYVINEKKYKGQKNPKLHYHLHYNKKGETHKIAPGIYRIRVVVDHEDKSQSAVTKNFTVLKKFEGFKVGENDSRKVKLGAKEIKFEYKILTNTKNIESIKYKFWFKEWRKNQIRPDGKKAGKYNYVEYPVAKGKYEGKTNPVVKDRIALKPEYKKGKYYVGIVLKEKGKKRGVSLYKSFEIVK